MSFTPTQKTQICEILPVNILQLDAKLIYQQQNISDEAESRVAELITEWFTTGVGRKYFATKPTESNMGSIIDPGERKQDIREAIATLLFFDDLDLGTRDSFAIERG